MIKRQIVIKSVISDELKKEKEKKLKEDIENAKDGLKQINEHLKSTPDSDDPGRKEIGDHAKKIAAQLAVMQYQSETMKDMKNGEYYTENVIEGFTTLRKGDNIKEALTTLEIIAENDIIQDVVQK